MTETTRRGLFVRTAGNVPGSFWRGSTSSLSLPPHAIITEDSLQITTESGEDLETET